MNRKSWVLAPAAGGSAGTALEEGAVNSALGRWIEERVREEGPVPFARFMEWALYHPEHGYYASGRVRIGDDDGDFTTAPHMSGVFARCLARWVAAADRALGRPEPFVLVEGGPGEGRLARDLLDALGEREPGLYTRLRYAADEASPALAARREALLEPHQDRCIPVPDRFTGVYLSNELLDAFPVHRVRRRGGRWEEALVVWDGGLTQTWGPASPEAQAFLDEQGLEVPEGCEAEACPRALAWLERVAGLLDRGYVLTIDYGDEAERLYGPRRPRGTCAAYRGHRMAEDLLARPGEQDLTAHVNFTALRRAGERLGLRAAPLLGQRDFLFAAGLAEEVALLEAELTGMDRMAAMQALAPLLLPDGGMGDAFKVLVQARAAPLDAVPLDPTAALPA